MADVSAALVVVMVVMDESFVLLWIALMYDWAEVVRDTKEDLHYIR